MASRSLVWRGFVVMFLIPGVYGVTLSSFIVVKFDRIVWLSCIVGHGTFQTSSVLYIEILLLLLTVCLLLEGKAWHV